MVTPSIEKKESWRRKEKGSFKYGEGPRLEVTTLLRAFLVSKKKLSLWRCSLPSFIANRRSVPRARIPRATSFRLLDAEDCATKICFSWQVRHNHRFQTYCITDYACRICTFALFLASWVAPAGSTSTTNLCFKFREASNRLA